METWEINTGTSKNSPACHNISPSFLWLKLRYTNVLFSCRAALLEIHSIKEKWGVDEFCICMTDNLPNTWPHGKYSMYLCCMKKSMNERNKIASNEIVSPWNI